MWDADQFKPRSNNVICPRCGFKYKREALRREWTGEYVCHGGGTNNCWDQRHPQEYVRGRLDRQIAPLIKLEPTDVFADPIAGIELQDRAENIIRDRQNRIIFVRS